MGVESSNLRASGELNVARRGVKEFSSEVHLYGGGQDQLAGHRGNLGVISQHGSDGRTSKGITR